MISNLNLSVVNLLSRPLFAIVVVVVVVVIVVVVVVVSYKLQKTFWLKKRHCSESIQLFLINIAGGQSGRGLHGDRAGLSGLPHSPEPVVLRRDGQHQGGDRMLTNRRITVAALGAPHLQH
jgi:hypothetical protein